MARGFDDWRSSLAHYGVPGMKKGVHREELRAQYLEKLKQMRASNGAVQAVTGESGSELNQRHREIIMQRRKARREAAMRRPTEEEIEKMRSQAQSDAIARAMAEGQKRGAENAAKAAAAAGAAKGAASAEEEKKKRGGGNMQVVKR